MAAPSYTEDLTDIDLAESATGWSEFTGNSYNTQGIPAGGDPDYPYIQGSFAVTQDCTKDTSIGSLGYNAGTGLTIPTDGAFLVWSSFSSALNIANYANGGFRVVVGSSLSDFRAWYVGGNDKGLYPYGGWQCHAANPTVTPDDTAGTPTTTYQYIGAAVNVTTGPKKGETHQVDALRYGRCSSIFTLGELADPATIVGFAALNDAQAARWGLIQKVEGGYKWQGRMQLGTAATAVYFSDTNKNIFVGFTPKVTRNFNLIEINNSSSYVSMRGFTFQVIDTDTASDGWFRMVDPATLYLTDCSFIDMDRFIFNYDTNPVELTGCIFRRCNYIVQNEAVFDGCTFSNSPSAIFMYADDISLISNCDFVSTGTGHAIELSPDHAGNTYSFDGNTFTAYTSANGTTGNEAIYNNSGGAVTINLTNTNSVPSYRNGTNASTTVNLTVTLTLTGIVSGSEVRIQTARGTSPSGAELFHVETTDGTDVEWSYNYSDYGAGYFIDIIIHNILYTYLSIDGILLPANNSTIPIQQLFDRWYANP